MFCPLPCGGAGTCSNVFPPAGALCADRPAVTLTAMPGGEVTLTAGRPSADREGRRLARVTSDLVRGARGCCGLGAARHLYICMELT